MTPPPWFMTDDEHAAMDLTSELANLMVKIVGDGPSANGDLGEIVDKIHGIQHTILAQAAGRAYPERYRTLGGWPRPGRVTQ